MAQPNPKIKNKLDDGSWNLPQCKCGNLMELTQVFEDVRKIDERYFYRDMSLFLCRCGNWLGLPEEGNTREITAEQFEAWNLFDREVGKYGPAWEEESAAAREAWKKIEPIFH